MALYIGKFECNDYHKVISFFGRSGACTSHLTKNLLSNMKSNSEGERKKEERRRLVLARRLALRTRAGAACAPCKSRKAKCSDYRPCARCRNLRPEDCVPYSEDMEASSRPRSTLPDSTVPNFPHIRDYASVLDSPPPRSSSGTQMYGSSHETTIGHHMEREIGGSSGPGDVYVENFDAFPPPHDVNLEIQVTYIS